MIQEWFREAKFGVFVHWGIYAVGRRGGESWPIARGGVSYNDYMKQMNRFTAAKYDADRWADLFARSGARYAVFTTKHHDGVTLWPSDLDGPSAARAHGRDYVGEFAASMRRKNLKVGLYFSHTDWSHLDHMRVVMGKSREEILAMRDELVDYIRLWLPHAGKQDLRGSKDHREAWEAFLSFHRAQLTELLTRYRPVDLIWFDLMLGREGFDYDTSGIRDLIHTLCPETVINSRLDGQGDYETPEQFIPVYPPKQAWELCITMDETWSYTGPDTLHKSPGELLAMFCECLGMGGNLLLNVGPDPDGVIPAPQVEILETFGKWIHKHSEAVYGTVRGLPHGYAFGNSSFNKQRDVIYLYLSHLPAVTTPVKGIRNKALRVTVLGTDTECATRRTGGADWLNVPGTLLIDIPRAATDEHVTVLKIELDGPLDLHSGEGVEIDAN